MNPFRLFRLALSFLTIVPVGELEGGVSEAEIAASRFAYPVVGLTMGLILAVANGVLARLGVAPGRSRASSWPWPRS